VKLDPRVLPESLVPKEHPDSQDFPDSRECRENLESWVPLENREYPVSWEKMVKTVWPVLMVVTVQTLKMVPREIWVLMVSRELTVQQQLTELTVKKENQETLAQMSRNLRELPDLTELTDSMD